jgi:hypothetical protein
MLLFWKSPAVRPTPRLGGFPNFALLRRNILSIFNRRVGS